jgi:hypothetical protein
VTVAQPLRLSAAGVDLSPRVKSTGTVVASPTDDAETIVASLTIAENVAVSAGVLLRGWGAFTVGTNGVSANLRIRKTDVAGTVLAATGAVTLAAADLAALAVDALDTSPALPNQVYVLTAELVSASAGSTFSAVRLSAIVL